MFRLTQSRNSVCSSINGVFNTVNTLGYVDSIPNPKKTLIQVLISHIHYGNTNKKIVHLTSPTPPPNSQQLQPEPKPGLSQPEADLMAQAQELSLPKPGLSHGLQAITSPALSYVRFNLQPPSKLKTTLL
jgi:hypothetical protein